MREPDNRHDPEAIRIDLVTGETIGYLPRDTRLHDEFPDRISARLVRITGGTPTNRRSARCWKSWCRNVERHAKAGRPRQGDRQDGN